MPEFRHVEADVLKSLHRLAELAIEEIVLAGFSASMIDDEQEPAGAKLEIDTGDYDTGGVYVDWKPHPQISEAVIQLAQAGDFENPIINKSATIKAAALEAILTVLKAANFNAEMSEEEMRPLSIKILSGPTTL